MSPATATLTDYPILKDSELRETNLRQVHTSAEPRVLELLAAVPEYVATRRALRNLLDHARVAPVAPVPALYEAAGAMVEAALEGKPLDTALDDSMPDLGLVHVYEGRNASLGIVIATNAREVIVGRIKAQAVERASQELTKRLDALLQANVGAILAGISQRLVVLVQEARQILTDQGRVADADDAIAQGRVEEWKASKALGDEYVALRELQNYWYTRTGGGTINFNGGTDQWVAYNKNPQDVSRHFSRIITGRPYKDQAQEKAFLDGAERLRWPASWIEHDTIWWYAENPDVIPWAPTSREIDELLNRLAALHHEHSTGRTKMHVNRVTTRAGA